MDKVRLGVIGVGGMGQSHIRAIQNDAWVQLAAVGDASRDAAERVAAENGVAPFEDYEALITSGLVEAVIVATPHYFHPPISIYAMGHGIHVLSEKPVAVTVKAAEAMNHAAQAAGVTYAVMYQQRTTPVYQAARKLIQEGHLGQLYRTCCIDTHFRTQAYYDSAQWRATWKGEGGGVTINQAPHGMDVFLSLGGLPSRATAHTGTRRHTIEVEDEASALLEYETGAVGYYHTSTNEAPSIQYMEFCGERGKLAIADGQLRFWSSEVPLQEFTVGAEGMWVRPPVAEQQVSVEEREAGHLAVIHNFAQAIRTGEPLITPGVEGLWSVELINALLLSGTRRRPVDIPVDREAYEAFIEEMIQGSERGM